MFNESKSQPKLAYNPIILKQYAFVTYTKQIKHNRYKEESKTKREIRHIRQHLSIYIKMLSLLF